jgi:5-methylthioadenosine/S-adenosylhomocysteine deaminase
MQSGDPGHSKFALTGRVVTMNDSFLVLPRGTVYIQGDSIAAVQDAAQPPPAGFAGIVPQDTEGTIYPGLIELHNHLSYNALRLWSVPKKYGDRSQWAGTPQYQQLITEPMKILGISPGLLPAVVRFVECKCLVAGVTTSQGIQLFSNAGVRRYYQGTLRVAEAPGDPALPPAATRIADVAATDRDAFLKELGTRQCFLLHLSEGTDDAARAHFTSLQAPDGSWAIRDSLAGIHCVALRHQDWQVMASHGASMIWSPMSNLLLYGGTADVAAAKASGIRIGIGSDWAPSGSKNLLGELKVARIFAQEMALGLSDRDLVAMATRDAAAILRWQGGLGTVEPGKHADLVIIDGVQSDAYSCLLAATETSISLVVVNGLPRFGRRPLMQALGAQGETVVVDGQQRMLGLKPTIEDPAIAEVGLAEATARLTDALGRLPELAHAQSLLPSPAVGELTQSTQSTQWYLALDELTDTGVDLRPSLTDEMNARPQIAAPLPIHALRLDTLTVVDDADLFDRLGAETNLPAFLVPALKAMY